MTCGSQVNNEVQTFAINNIFSYILMWDYSYFYRLLQNTTHTKKGKKRERKECKFRTIITRTCFAIKKINLSISNKITFVVFWNLPSNMQNLTSTDVGRLLWSYYYYCKWLEFWFCVWNNHKFCRHL